MVVCNRYQVNILALSFWINLSFDLSLLLVLNLIPLIWLGNR